MASAKKSKPQKKFKIGKYGWQPDLPDARDHKFSAMVSAPRLIPSKVDLSTSPFMPPVYDQGQLGSCTANGSGAAMQFAMRKEGLPDFIPSRLFIYYNERVIERTVKQDSGAQIRDAVKALATKGCCDETLWPYVVSKFATKPPATVYRTALKTTATQYMRVDNTNESELKGAIAAGFGVVFGMTVYTQFESAQAAKNGKIKMPNLKKDKALGGHCMIIVGYDDKTKMYKVRNSWGAGWGDKGYCYIPYAYLQDTNLADDFWTIRIVS